MTPTAHLAFFICHFSFREQTFFFLKQNSVFLPLSTFIVWLVKKKKMGIFSDPYTLLQVLGKMLRDQI